MNQPSSRSGFSLVELAVSLGITVLLFGLIMHAIRGLTNLSSTSLSAGRVEAAASSVTAKIAGELRWADPGSLLITAQNGATRVDFSVAEGYDGVGTIWSTPITYLVEPMERDANENGVADEVRLLRIQDGQTRTLCRNIPAGGFSLAPVDEALLISVTVFTEDRDGRILEATADASSHLLNRNSW